MASCNSRLSSSKLTTNAGACSPHGLLTKECGWKFKSQPVKTTLVIQKLISKRIQNTVVDAVTPPLPGCPCSDLSNSASSVMPMLWPQKPVQMVPCSDSEDGKKLRILGQRITLAYLLGPMEYRGPLWEGRRTVKGGKGMRDKKQRLKDVLQRWREGQRA